MDKFSCVPGLMNEVANEVGVRFSCRSWKGQGCKESYSPNN